MLEIMSTITDFVKSINIKNGDEFLSFGKIPNQQGQQIAQATGITSLSGIQKIIKVYDVIHIFKSHGDDKAEKARGQIGVIISDFDLINEILRFPDEVAKGAIVERGKQSILFKKRIICRYIIAAVLEKMKDVTVLRIKTLYKKP